MLGTAFPASRVLLVEQPGAWGRAGLRESQFDASVAAQLEAALGNQNVRVLAIRRPGRAESSSIRRWGFADCRPGRERLTWGSFEQDVELLHLDVDADRRPDPELAYLICAHSKHDVCCAVRGRPVAKAMALARPEQTWECSHVGGERFAANALVLPYGLLYGRVLPFGVAGFAEASERGEVIGALLRGKVGLTPPAQAALAFAHSLLEGSHVGDVQVHSVRQHLADQVHVHLDTPTGRVAVTVQQHRSEPAVLTCQSTAETRAWIYTPVDYTPLD
jgi:hypothetical protein